LRLTPQEQLQVSGAVSNPNMIDFSIPTTDSGYNPVTNVWTIAVQSALPTISTNAAIINGYSQAGASQNTLSQADNTALTIAINGAGRKYRHRCVVHDRDRQPVWRYGRGTGEHRRFQRRGRGRRAESESGLVETGPDHSDSLELWR
jgi:hypothetical protein